MAEEGQEAGLRSRPRPPQSLLSIDSAAGFVPAPDLVQWISATFLEEGAALENPEHIHLRDATIGALWTSVGNSRRGRQVIGQCEIGKPTGTMGKWSRARAEQQITEWFGCIPDFILTFDAGYADSCSDARFMALVEHELYHAGQDTDEFGMPRFRKDSGMPAFCLKGHDIEEFVGVVRRYGADAAGVTAMIEAAKEGPTVAAAEIDFACGNCLK
jgi:hypothetical protein